MGKIFATIERFLAASHSTNEEAFLVEIAHQDLLNQLVWVTALLSGRFRQPGLLLGREMYFHGLRVRQNLAYGKGEQFRFVAIIPTQKARI
ncbi:MAG: hypothetical protein ABSG51_12395 [Terracidiphilus sp.]|jgi:hypothetical protein